jgi:hypothetical protein
MSGPENRTDRKAYEDADFRGLARIFTTLNKRRISVQGENMNRCVYVDVSEVIRVHQRPLGALGLVVAAAMAAALFLSAPPCSAQEGTITTAPTSTAEASGWAFDLSASYYSFRNQDDFTLAVLRADRGQLHLEARYNYEAIDSGSLFVGWKFSGGNKLTWEVTPMLGAVFGQKEGIAPGLEFSLGYGIVDFYSESEYVRDTDVKEDSFTYSWNELGFSPLEWLRFGIVTQRSMVYQSDRDIQRGVFAQVKYRKATLGAYVFNPDDSDSRYMVFSLGAEF